MLNKVFSTLSLIVIISVLSSVTLAQSAPLSSGMLDVIQQAHEKQRKALTGSWFVTVNSTANQFNPSYLLLAINEGGSAISSQQGEVTAYPNAIWGVPVVQTPKFGSWSHKGGREFALSQFSLFYFSLVRDTEPRSYLGITKVWMAVTLDETGNSFTATYVKAERINFAGQVVPIPGGGDLTMHGTRITAEPQP